MQHGLLCACSRTGSEGGLECSTGCLVLVDVQGVRGDSSAARAALCL